ncbi:MAG: hypothetical protein HAW60_06230 [Bdellovibrionales bacterium]|nr:hypothetical protein [Bdellovibrionales bacterium]
MQKIKNPKMFLVILSSFMFLTSCLEGLSEVSDPSEVLSRVPTTVEEAEQVSAAVSEKTIRLEKLLFKTSYGKFTFFISRSNRGDNLANVLLTKDFNRDKMDDWVSQVIASIGSNVVDEKIEEIKALRDAETDPSLIARYNKIINNIEAKKSISNKKIVEFKKIIVSAKIHLLNVLEWISAISLRRITHEKSLDTAISTVSALDPLSKKLEEIEGEDEDDDE